MALTYSEIVPLGKSAPTFSLKGLDGKNHALDDLKGGKSVVVMFICNHCPYVQATEERLGRLARELASKGARFVGINSNDTDQVPEDSPDRMHEQAKRAGFGFPYLLDETQEVARAYGAVCTPDIFVFDADCRLRYRGRIDDSWKDQRKVTRQDLRDAIEAVIESRPVSTDQIPSMGCSIKWKSWLARR